MCIRDRLGGAHLALENISILATKTVEDSRIGGSPLEKSTRYVSFSDKINGEYQFYKEPKLLKSDHRNLFLETCRNLFDTYVQFTEPIRDHVRKCLPWDSKISHNAYERSVRANGFDIIRGLLPAATLTNMGVFGNGRFFENLISKLKVDSLLELKEIGQLSFEELNKVIPSFVRRADTNHRHFQDFRGFDFSQKEFVSKIANSQLGKLNPDNSGLVNLIDYDTDAENKVIAAILYPYSSIPLQQIRDKVDSMSDIEKTKIIKKAADLREHRRHKPDRGLELAFYTFDILGDYGMYRDLQRHRMLTQERQPLSTRFGYNTPHEIEDAGLGNQYHEAMASAADAFEKIFKDYPINHIWAFKYDSRAKNEKSSLKGINVHADFAAVNVNFWITPKEANLNPDSGGLVVYDVESPKDWNFNTYNKDQLINIFSIYGEIKNSKQLANSIVRLRRKKKIEKTIDLIGIINPFSKKK